MRCSPLDREHRNEVIKAYRNNAHVIRREEAATVVRGFFSGRPADHFRHAAHALAEALRVYCADRDPTFTASLLAMQAGRAEPVYAPDAKPTAREIAQRELDRVTS